jgi:hypothetical protein
MKMRRKPVPPTPADAAAPDTAPAPAAAGRTRLVTRRHVLASLATAAAAAPVIAHVEGRPAPVTRPRRRWIGHW